MRKIINIINRECLGLLGRTRRRKRRVENKLKKNEISMDNYKDVCDNVTMETYKTYRLTINPIMAGARLAVTQSAPSCKCVINPRPPFEVKHENLHANLPGQENR